MRLGYAPAMAGRRGELVVEIQRLLPATRPVGYDAFIETEARRELHGNGWTDAFDRLEHLLLEPSQSGESPQSSQSRGPELDHGADV